MTTANGYSTNTEAEFNVVDGDKVVSSNLQGFMDSAFPVFGRRFLTTGDAARGDGSNVAFYPAAGGRINDKTLCYVGHLISCWSASPHDNSTTRAGFLYGDATRISLIESAAGRMFGFPVRCVRGN